MSSDRIQVPWEQICLSQTHCNALHRAATRYHTLQPNHTPSLPHTHLLQIQVPLWPVMSTLSPTHTRIRCNMLQHCNTITHPSLPYAYLPKIQVPSWPVKIKLRLSRGYGPVCVGVWAHVRMRINIFMCIYIYMFMYIYVHIYMYVQSAAIQEVRAYLYACVITYICEYTCIYMCIYM